MSASSHDRTAEIQAIRERHSVRNYLDRKIDPDIAQKLETYIKEANRESGLHFQFLQDAGKTFNRLLTRAAGLGSAPSVIACVGPNGADLEERIGYYGERIVLYAQQLGLNTCWAGTFNAKNTPAQILPGERLVIVIAAGYGENPGKPHRSKSLEKVAVYTGQGEMPDWFRRGVELALLAPTAINQQKFEIHLDEKGQVSFLDKKGIFSKVDLGIVKYHFDIGAARI